MIKIKQLEAPGIEHIIIDLILKASGYVFWQLDHQAFTIINDREIDKLKVLAIKNSKTREFSFYFDITALG
ncbi:MAG TPA: hypothetical protein VJ964_09335 [Balneolaceae bacterium]|nr:hypothetical protein [Balneolaceae bacterium]